MASYFSNKLESILERWQSRRGRCIEISPSRPQVASKQQATINKRGSRQFYHHQAPSSSSTTSSNYFKHHQDAHSGKQRDKNTNNNTLPTQNAPARAIGINKPGGTKLSNSNTFHYSHMSTSRKLRRSRGPCSGPIDATSLAARSRPPVLVAATTTTNCLGLLYLIAITYIACLHHHHHQCHAQEQQQAAQLPPLEPIRPINGPLFIGVPPFNWRQFTQRLVSQWSSHDRRDRWTRVPSSSTSQDSIREEYRYPSRRQSQLMRTIERIRNRMGARNSIRVHNAFRDFAWRVLARLSMPTPVIYELRRQNMYSADDDLMNDSLHDKNTTKTIRTRRLINEGLDLLANSHKSWRQHQAQRTHRAAYDDDDDDEPESLRERFRMRLKELLSLSRRSLVGRVVRLPSLFPFKRQEPEDDDKPATTTGGHNGAGSSRASRRQRRKRRRKLADRQMISINGKQYYVNDDGELKELKESQSKESE